MIRRVPFLQQAFKKRARNLGVDFGGGRPLRHEVQRGRVAKVIVKSKRLRRLGIGSLNSARAFKANMVPTGCYGAQVTGMTVTNVAKMRVAFHTSCFKKAQARSCTVDLEFVGKHHDPQYDAIVLPVTTWHCCLWDQVLPRQLLLRLFSFAVNAAKSDSFVVRGPATACVHALHQIGWDGEGLGVWKNGAAIRSTLMPSLPRT